MGKFDNGPKSFHMCFNIEGMLRNNTNKKLGKLFVNNDGTPANGADVRKELKGELAKGRKVLPMGDGCDNFDFQTGCLGHPIEEDKPK